MILPSSTVSPRTMSATCCQEDRYRQEKNRKGKSTITLRSSGLSYQSLGADLDLLLNYTSYFLNSEATPKGVASWILTYKLLCVSHDRLTLERVQNLRKSGIRTPSADKMPSAALPLCYPSILPLSGLCFVFCSLRASRRWWKRGMDSNHRPSGYETDELPTALPHFGKGNDPIFFGRTG